MKVIPVPIDRIEIVPDRDHRGENVDLDDLVQSMRAIGLLHPLLVLPPTDGGTYELLAGYRRLRAARKLGWTQVPVEVLDVDVLKAELVTIDENLARKNLPPSEEGRQHKRAKEIYERLFPQTQHGGARDANGHGGHLKQPSYVERVAKVTGKSPRTIRRKIKIAECGTPTLNAALDAGQVNTSEAERIAGFSPEQQDIKVAKIIGQEKEAKAATAPTPSSTVSMVKHPMESSPVALAEAVLKAAVQFQESIKGGEITDPDRVLELAQQVRDLLNDVSLIVRRKHPMKTAAST